MTGFVTPEPLLPDIIRLHAKWKGRKEAAICGDTRLSWAEFGRRVDRVANALHGLGLKEGDMVGVLMTNSLDMLEVLIGCVMAGCCSVPVNLSVPKPAAVGMLRDAGAKALFCSPAQAEMLDDIDIPHRIVSGASRPGWTDYAAFRDGAPATVPAARITPDLPLNVIYSSGTTGLPKGILHTQKTRLAMARDVGMTLRYDSGARTLASIGLYSNISWVAMLGTLVAGGTLVIHDGFDAVRTLETIEKERITHAAMVPLQFQRLMEVPGQERFDLSSIRAFMCCGSPLHEGLKRQLFARLPSGIIELYGLTEGVITTLDPEDAEGRWSSVGKPMLGCDMILLDDDDRPCPAGTPGEIVFYGRIMMPGYLNRAEATAEAIWIDDRGRTWLRTGDVGQLDEDGFLYIVDRKKDMILSGGQNIYPADIEAVMMNHEHVSEVAVVGVPHPVWGETPYAVVVPKGRADPDEIRDWTNARVGKQQRIAGVAFRDELPRNPNGKILKRELRKEVP